jgi:PHD/YefM family antitoxin component YafN of YafNO toxin-antitoxin module
MHILEKGAAGMIKVSAAEFQRNIGRYQDMALVQPVAVTRNGRERTVMISVEEYHRLKRRDRQVLKLEDFTDADVAALEKARAPDSSKTFDRELKR